MGTCAAKVAEWIDEIVKGELIYPLGKAEVETHGTVDQKKRLT